MMFWGMEEGLKAGGERKRWGGRGGKQESKRNHGQDGRKPRWIDGGKERVEREGGKRGNQEEDKARGG